MKEAAEREQKNEWNTDWQPQPVPSYSPVNERVECSGIRANSLCQADFPPSEKFEAEGRSRKRGSMEKEKGVDG